jgi:hypothetical protein
MTEEERPRSFYGIEMPEAERLCDLCDAIPGKPQVCLGDGRYHRHGMIHTKGNRLIWVCDSCYAIEKGLRG